VSCPTVTEKWSEIEILYGGSFDPPHLGHRQVVQELLASLSPKALRILPAGSPPQKKDVTPAHHRLEMCRRTFGNLPGVLIDSTEIQAQLSQDPPPSYTQSTLKTYTQPVAFAIGTDQLLNLKTWYGYPEILSQCRWIIFGRPPFDPSRADAEIQRLKKTLPNPPQIHWVDLRTPTVDSTSLREELISHPDQPLTHWVVKHLTPETMSYIQEEGLYGRSPQ